MKKFAISISIILLVVGITGCNPNQIPSVVQPSEIVNNSSIAFNDNNTMTVGNNTYIAINKDGEPSDQAQIILDILKKFEETHPELSVTDWNIEKQEDGYSISPYIFGLWIRHTPKLQ